jgi:hypothetical protein
MKKSLFIFLLALTFNVQAQEVAKTVLFDCKGTISLLLTNPATTKWLGGGTSNIAGNFGLNYDLNYKRRCSLGQ